MNNEKSSKAGKHLVIAIIIVAVSMIIINNPKLLVFLSPEEQAEILDFKMKYFSSYMIPVGKKITLGMIISVVLVLAEASIIHSIIVIISKKLKLKDRHAETIKTLLLNFVSYAVVIFAIIIALSILGVNMMAIIAGLGVMSLVVGFGAETLIEDVITGLFFVFEGQFHIGDIITVEGFRGTVTSIGIRTTQITDLGGNIRIINNSDIRSLTNLSERYSAAVSIISIAYEASLENAEKVITDELAKMPEKYPTIFKEPPSYTGVEELGASSVDLRIVAYVDEPNLYSARRTMNRELKLALDKAGIDIPFPQVVVHKA